MNTTTTNEAVTTGDTVTITPAYQMATKRSDRWDEWTGRRGEVLRLAGNDALVAVEGARDEVWITLRRLVRAA